MEEEMEEMEEMAQRFLEEVGVGEVQQESPI